MLAKPVLTAIQSILTAAWPEGRRLNRQENTCKRA
jgi:hypothetical protein